MPEEFTLGIWTCVGAFIVVSMAILIVWTHHLHAKRRILREFLEKHPEHLSEL